MVDHIWKTTLSTFKHIIISFHSQTTGEVVIMLSAFDTRWEMTTEWSSNLSRLPAGHALSPPCCFKDEVKWWVLMLSRVLSLVCPWLSKCALLLLEGRSSIQCKDLTAWLFFILSALNEWCLTHSRYSKHRWWIYYPRVLGPIFSPALSQLLS